MLYSIQSYADVFYLPKVGYAFYADKARK